MGTGADSAVLGPAVVSSDPPGDPTEDRPVSVVVALHEPVATSSTPTATKVALRPRLLAE